MKIIIAGDIHGSAYWCEKLTQYFNETDADMLLLTGDILYHGPRNDLPQDYAPKKVAPMLNALSDKILCVKGNCEAEVDNLLLDFAIAQNAFVVTDGKKLFVTHGHNNPDKLAGANLLVNGHTHVPRFETVGDITVINPGSVSIPKENSPHSCIMLCDNTVSFIDLDAKTTYRTEKI